MLMEYGDDAPWSRPFCSSFIQPSRQCKPVVSSFICVYNAWGESLSSTPVAEWNKNCSVSKLNTAWITGGRPMSRAIGCTHEVLRRGAWCNFCKRCTSKAKSCGSFKIFERNMPVCLTFLHLNVHPQRTLDSGVRYRCATYTVAG